MTARLSPRAKDKKLATEPEDETLSPIDTGLTMLGYKENIFGQICSLLIILVSLGWLIIFLVIIIDQYNNCEFKSIDDACFFGDYFIFGDYDTNSK